MLHLLEFVKNADDARVPSELTGEGIARASWIDVRHVPQNVRPLIRDGLVAERSSHVTGGTRRRKTYCLTDPGRRAAIRARETLVDQTVPVRDDSGVRELPLFIVLEQTGSRRSLLELARRAAVNGVLDRSTLDSAPIPTGHGSGGVGFVEMLQNAPHVEGFVGRDRELRLVTSDSGPPLFVAQGVAGIGKSWFGAKACELLHDKKNLFWHRVRPWDTSQSVLADIADFIDAIGRPNLRSVIVRGDGALARRILRDDLPGTKSLLVFDDAHEAMPDVLLLLRDLGNVVAVAKDVRMLVLTRRSLTFYDRRDVMLARTVCEIDLQGLDIQELRTLIPQGGDTVALLNVGRKLGGHPLLLELARSAGHPGSAGGYLRDARRFLEEEVYQDLSVHEKAMMKLAALYRTPVPREAFFASPELTYDVLVPLLSKALIRRVGDDAFEVHDTIRDYFDSILGGGERRALGDYAVDHLRTLAFRAESTGDYASSVNYLSNALQIHRSGGNRILLLEALGDACQPMGDLPETLNSYKEGLTLTNDPLVIARLHRKAAKALLVRGDTRPASKEVEEGLRALGNEPSVERGWLELLRGDIAWSESENAARALPSVRTGLEILRAKGEMHGEAEALLLLGDILIHMPQGDSDEGVRLYQAALELATILSDGNLMSEAHGNLAHFFTLHAPNVEKAMAHITAEEASARGQDYLTRLYSARWKSVIQIELLGDFAAAETSLNEMLVLACRTYNREANYIARHKLADVAFFRRDFANARRRYETLWEESRDGGLFSFEWAIRSLWMAAECCLWQGDREGFERLVAEIDGPGVEDHLDDRMVVVDILHALSGFVRGDWAMFEFSFSRGLGAAERAVSTQEAPYGFFSFLVPYYYGMVLRAQGQEDKAAPQVSRALEILRTYGMEARHDVLVHGQDHLVHVLRDWAAPKPAED